MCGILGVISSKIKLNNEILEKALNKMIHRGPDDFGIYWENSVFLGHRRLKIVDLSEAAKQPMSNEDETLWLVFNGEIYNFQELRRDLQLQGHWFKSQSDTEVILHLYEQYGADCLKYLRGIFSFAIWDKTKKQLFCARDHFGVKPFYYYFLNNTFIFASELRAILATSLVKKELNLQAVSDFFQFLSVIEPETIIKGVKPLLAGHYLFYSDGKLEIKKYWDLEQFGVLKKPVANKETINKQIKELLEESIKMQMVSDVPLGVFLSGGIDSSSLTALASKYVSKPLKTISLVFQEQKFDERPFSRMVAKKFGTEHQEVLITEKEILEQIIPFIKSMDQPSGDGFNTFLISKTAQEIGLTVILSGLGGDEIFAGYRTFRDALNLYRRANFIPELIKRKIKNILQENPDRLDFQRLLDFLKSPQEFLDAYLFFRTVFPNSFRERFFSQFFKKESENDGRKHFAYFRSKIKNLDYINASSYLELNIYMRNTLLRDTDMMSMVHSLETRVPLLDQKLVEYVFSLPGYLKVKKNLAKPLLTGTMKDVLPPEVILRKKRGFAFPYDKWLGQGLRPLMEQSFNDLEKTDYFDINEVKKIWQLFLKKRAGITWSRPWLFLVFNLWLKENFK